MARRSKQTIQKRQKERARMEKKKRKDVRRVELKEIRADAPPRPEGAEDPDIAHIKPGPQPLPPEFTGALEPEPGLDPESEEEEES